MILYLGDPLYRPFPAGIAPFNPPPPQYSLALSSRYVLNGDRPTGTVTLPNPAPTGGTVVNLSSSMTSLATVPPRRHGAWWIDHRDVHHHRRGNSAGHLGYTGEDYSVGCRTKYPHGVALAGWGVRESRLHHRRRVGLGTGFLELQCWFWRSGCRIRFEHSFDLCSASVAVPQGTSQATFTINSSYVTSATTGAITASLLGATSHSSLTLYPALSAFSVSPTSVPGGANATLVIYLGANAPAGGWPVNLSSGNPSVVSVPATVTVPAGTRYLQVPVTTTPQCNNTPVTLTASSGASTLNPTLTVTPPPPSSLSFVSSVRGGRQSRPRSLFPIQHAARDCP